MSHAAHAAELLHLSSFLAPAPSSPMGQARGLGALRAAHALSSSMVQWETLDSLLAISLCCGQQPALPKGGRAPLVHQGKGPLHVPGHLAALTWAPAPVATLQALLEEGIDE